MRTESSDDELSNRSIVHIRTVSGLGGGPEKTILKSLRCYREFGFSGMAIYLHPPKSNEIHFLRNKYDSLGLELVTLPDRGPLDFTLIGKILDIVKKKEGCILQVHDDKSLYIGTLVSILNGLPLVAMNHGWTSRGHQVLKRYLYRKIAGLCLRRADRCIPVSKDIECEIIKLGVKSNRIRLIENGIDCLEFRKQSGIDVKRRKSELSICESAFLIGGLGRLAREKGFDRLIQMVKRLRENGFNVGLVIGGEGYFRKDLANLIDSLGLQEYVKLIGYVSDPREFFDLIDLFFLSSEAEGLPNVLLEAMAMEVPVVSTKVNGVLGLIEDERTGALVDFDSPTEWDKIVIGQMTNPTLRRCIAERAREWVENRFSFQKRMAKVVSVYNELLDMLK